MRREAEDIYRRAAALLGWGMEDIRTFSPRMLRDLLERKSGSEDSRINSRARLIINAIDWGLDPRNPQPLWPRCPRRN